LLGVFAELQEGLRRVNQAEPTSEEVLGLRALAASGVDRLAKIAGTLQLEIDGAGTEAE
jgi:hypothetical protein